MTSQLYKDEVLHNQVLRLVDAAGHTGVTIAELRDALPAHHHGTLSGVLSLLHRDMRIARLVDKRNGCKIYVEPDFLDGRSAEAQGRGVSKEEALFGQSLVGFLEYWMQVDTEGARFVTDKTKAERNQKMFFNQLKRMWEDRP